MIRRATGANENSCGSCYARAPEVGDTVGAASIAREKREAERERVLKRNTIAKI
jgi:hypothetical protein